MPELKKNAIDNIDNLFLRSEDFAYRKKFNRGRYEALMKEIEIIIRESVFLSNMK